MSINATLDASRLFKTLERKAEVTHKSLASVIKEQAKLAAKEFINVIPPTTGGSLSGKEPLGTQRKAGKAAVAADVRKAYMTKGEAFAIIKKRSPDLAKRFWKLVNTDVAAARRLIQEKVPELKFLEKFGAIDPKVYQDARSPRTGRVKIKYPRQLVTGKADINTLIKKQQSKVGTAKSGAFRAAAAAGIKVAGIPGWITSQRGTGRGKNNLHDALRPFIEMAVTVPYVDTHNRGNRLVTAVIGNRVRAMERQIEHLLKKEWKGKI